MWSQRFIFPQMVLKLEVAFFQLNFQASLYNAAQLGSIVEKEGGRKSWGERKRKGSTYTHTHSSHKEAL